MILSEWIEKYGDCEVTEEIDKCIIKQPKTVWDLKGGDKYFFIGAIGFVREDVYGSCNADRGCISQGNAFLTKEEAEFEVEKRKVIAELKRYAYEFSEDEWCDGDVYKFSIFYDYSFDCLEVDYRFMVKFANGIYFKSEEDADEAIETVGEDRIKKYLFGIES